MDNLPPGELCPACHRDIARRARRIARWVAMGTSLLVAAYIVLSVPTDRTARAVGASAVVIWYLLTTLVVSRIAREWIK